MVETMVPQDIPLPSAVIKSRPRVMQDGRPWESLGTFEKGVKELDANQWLVNRCQDAQSHDIQDVPPPYMPLEHLGAAEFDLTNELAAEQLARRTSQEQESDANEAAYKARF